MVAEVCVPERVAMERFQILESHVDSYWQENVHSGFIFVSI